MECLYVIDNIMRNIILNYNISTYNFLHSS